MVLATTVTTCQSLYIAYTTTTLCGKPYYHPCEKWDLDMETQNGRIGLTHLALKPMMSPHQYSQPLFFILSSEESQLALGGL